MNTFTIYKRTSEIENPKLGDIIKFRDLFVEIMHIQMKGFFYLDGPECWRLSVKKV
jgi:hypothetical protein